jgi:hypothetical protein
MSLCLGGRVEAVDVAAARIVDEVLLRGADEVAELVVPAPISTATRRPLKGKAGWVAGCSRNRDAGRIVGLGGQHEGVRFSTPGAVSMACSVEAAEAAHKKSSTAMFRGQVARRISLRTRSRARAQEFLCRARARERYVTRGALKSWKTVAASAEGRRTVGCYINLGCLRRVAGVKGALHRCGSEVWFPSMLCLELEALPHTRLRLRRRLRLRLQLQLEVELAAPNPALRCAAPDCSDGSPKKRHRHAVHTYIHTCEYTANTARERD